jgi:hypothetical protein
MVRPKSIFCERERNAETLNSVRGLRLLEESCYDPLVVLRDGGTSVRDHWILCRKPVAATVVAHLLFAGALRAEFVLLADGARVRPRQSARTKLQGCWAVTVAPSCREQAPTS